MTGALLYKLHSASLSFKEKRLRIKAFRHIEKKNTSRNKHCRLFSINHDDVNCFSMLGCVNILKVLIKVTVMTCVNIWNNFVTFWTTYNGVASGLFQNIVMQSHTDNNSFELPMAKWFALILDIHQTVADVAAPVDETSNECKIHTRTMLLYQKTNKERLLYYTRVYVIYCTVKSYIFVGVKFRGFLNSLNSRALLNS